MRNRTSLDTCKQFLLALLMLFSLGLLASCGSSHHDDDDPPVIMKNTPDQTFRSLNFDVHGCRYGPTRIVTFDRRNRS